MIGAVVPVCNRRQNLELLLTSLQTQKTDDLAVVVADDGSTDGTRDQAHRQHPNVVLFGRVDWLP
ncbi:MAG: glycosyltransferase, partial [Sciscionella sp.]